MLPVIEIYDLLDNRILSISKGIKKRLTFFNSSPTYSQIKNIEKNCKHLIILKNNKKFISFNLQFN